MLSPRNTNCFWSILDNPTDFLLHGVLYKAGLDFHFEKLWIGFDSFYDDTDPDSKSSG